MPRLSQKQQYMKKLRYILFTAVYLRSRRRARGVRRRMDDWIIVYLCLRLSQLHSSRYLSRDDYRINDHSIFAKDADVGTEDQVPWLKEYEFLAKYRMSRDSLEALLGAIKDHPTFTQHTDFKRKMTDPRYQLMVFLSFIGSEGNGASNPQLRSKFGTGNGTNDLFIERTIVAIRDRLKEYLSWPDEEERKDIASRFAEDHFHGCVGIVDGTLFPLATRPETDDHGDYKGRKHLYTLTVMIVTDDERKIRYYYSGWPGSTHDNRVFRNSRLYRQPEEFFSPTEYILGDSAYDNQWFCVSAYKKSAGQELPRDRERFNDCLKKPRVISEHSIGMLKARFPYLRSIRKVIKDRRSLQEILHVIDCCVLLHNFLIEHNDLGELGWQQARDDSTAVEESVPEGYFLDEPIPLNAPKDLRRRQLTTYVNDHYV